MYRVDVSSVPVFGAQPHVLGGSPPAEGGASGVAAGGDLAALHRAGLTSSLYLPT